MTKDEFAHLPLSAALAMIWENDSALASKLQYIEAPRPAMPPKYDTRLRTKGGYVYASECDASQLSYYHARASKPPTDEKYREKGEKEAKALAFFIRWRAENPDACWVGERYQQGSIKAAPPSSRPRVSDWDDAGTPRENTGSARSADPDYGPEDALPF